MPCRSMTTLSIKHGDRRLRRVAPSSLSRRYAISLGTNAGQSDPTEGNGEADSDNSQTDAHWDHERQSQQSYAPQGRPDVLMALRRRPTGIVTPDTPLSTLRTAGAVRHIVTSWKTDTDHYIGCTQLHLRPCRQRTLSRAFPLHHNSFTSSRGAFPTRHISVT